MEEHSKRKSTEINEGMHSSESTREGMQREGSGGRIRRAGGEGRGGEEWGGDKI